MLLPEDWLAGKTANVMYILTVSVKTSDVTLYSKPNALSVNHSVCKCINSKDTKKSASVTPHFLHDKRRPAVKEDLSHSHCIPHRDIDVIFTFVSGLSGSGQNPEQLSTSPRSSIFFDPM